MRDFFIRLLGGFTFQDLIDNAETEIRILERTIEDRDSTIEELQALIPEPKKRGRTRKA